jgi:hypothetical protein
MDIIIVIAVGIGILKTIEWIGSAASGKDYYDSPLAKSLDEKRPEPSPETLQHVAVLQNTPSFQLNTDDAFTLLATVGVRPYTAVDELNKQEVTNNYKIFLLVESKDAAAFEGHLAARLSLQKAPKRSCGRQLYKCSADEMSSAVNACLMYGYNHIV